MEPETTGFKGVVGMWITEMISIRFPFVSFVGGN